MRGQDKMSEMTDWLISLVMTYGPGLVMSIVTLFVGLWLSTGWSTAWTMRCSPGGATLLRFMHSLASIGLRVMLIISVASMVGVPNHLICSGHRCCRPGGGPGIAGQSRQFRRWSTDSVLQAFQNRRCD